MHAREQEAETWKDERGTAEKGKHFWKYPTERGSEIWKEVAQTPANVNNPVAIWKDCELPDVGDYVLLVSLCLTYAQYRT